MKHLNKLIAIAVLFFNLFSPLGGIKGGYSQSDSSYVPLRYMAINSGNSSVQYGCWEYKLCRQQDVENLRNYITTWQPDIIMISEIYMSGQLTDSMFYGPILPVGYDGVCGRSVSRFTGDTVTWDAPDASHEHECIAWKTSRLQLIQGSELSVYGRNDSYGLNNCNFCFTGFRAKLLLEGQDTITAIAVHPNSTDTDCRVYEISNYWMQLAQGNKVIIGGDFNTSDVNELQVPTNYKINFSKGNYWDLAYFADHYSAVYALGLYKKHLDHAFSNFGEPCTSCGTHYGTSDLQYGVALGGYNNHPRADNGEGMDHRQILVDMKIPCALPKSNFVYTINDLQISFIDSSLHTYSWYWDFGDGQSSVSQNPVHTFDTYGVYNVCLYASSSCGIDTLCQTIELNPTQYQEKILQKIKIFPNPADEVLFIENFNHLTGTNIKIFNIWGVPVLSSQIVTQTNVIPVQIKGLNQGIYFIVFENNNFRYIKRFTKIDLY